MPVRSFQNRFPVLDPSVYVDETATVIGDVVIGADSSVWPTSVIRGDVNRIRVGARTNIQDGSVIHAQSRRAERPDGVPTYIGDDVTVGHQCMLHACTIEDRCLIGMGSIVLDGAVLRENVLLGAGSLVTQGKELAGGYLWLGRPARRVRPLSASEIAMIAGSAAQYVTLKELYRKA